VCLSCVIEKLNLWYKSILHFTNILVILKQDEIPFWLEVTLVSTFFIYDLKFMQNILLFTDLIFIGLFSS